MGEARETHVESFETHPSRYRHWMLTVDGSIATLTLNIQEENGLRSDYLLKLNSYDLSVDIELADAIERIRFEYPRVCAVKITSALPRIFCAGANIRMLASSTHGFKVNFCRYTNETRLAIEDASRFSSISFIAACNGTASGGGYELALACDAIYLIDDGSSAVSLPEVPLLGVLPGTGGLTRLVDKRKVRRDLADVFCTKAEGFRARDAVQMRIIDGSFPRSKWEEGMRQVMDNAVTTHSPRTFSPVALPPLHVDTTIGRRYSHVQLAFDPNERVATLTISSPQLPAPANSEQLARDGAATWSLAAFRELDDALCHLRFNFPNVGVVRLETKGNPDLVLAHDQAILSLESTDGFAQEIRLYQARVLRRLDNTAKSLFAIIEPGSCFVGSLFELALAADRSYHLSDGAGATTIQVTESQLGRFPMTHGPSRLAVRFAGEPEKIDDIFKISGRIAGEQAFELGLVTLAPDDIDWEDEVRIAIEERISLSPDALTGMEQNLRFVGHETCDTKIFGRLSAWQNWIFQRPNAVGEQGALTLYGHPERPKFQWART